MKPQIEPVSTEQMLNCLGLAIDEAKLVREMIECQALADELKTANPFADELVFLHKEIKYVEAKLSEIRSKASRAKLCVVKTAVPSATRQSIVN